MHRVSVYAASVVLAGVLACGVLFAQSPAPTTADKATTRQKAADDLQKKRLKAAEELAAERKAHKEWNTRRRQIIEELARRRANCKKQANEQRLHFAKRWRFMRKCVVG
jgi:hypothetical protein